ncbi:hypothetical protein GCM10027073_67420 [Streptomyces chlorus]|uniref:Uncharacterized protein n=1 Tax=Streptomyces chlorus TaxID=887452 RepID=A0ABW1DZ23_9ACTN
MTKAEKEALIAGLGEGVAAGAIEPEYAVWLLNKVAKYAKVTAQRSIEDAVAPHVVAAAEALTKGVQAPDDERND